MKAMSDHVHTQACVVTCRRYDGTTESKDPAPATKPLGHEERARAWLVDGPYTTDLESCVKRLATAFSEVEAAAKREITDRLDRDMDCSSAGCWNEATEQDGWCSEHLKIDPSNFFYRGPTDSKTICENINKAIAELRAGDEAEEADDEPEFTGTPMTLDQVSAMRKEMWSKLAEVELEMGPSMKALLATAEPKAEEALVSVAEFYRKDAAGNVSHVRTELEPTCTCGASATGSKIHSDWCP